MQHDGAVFSAVFADVGCVESFGQDEIHLVCATLPIAPDGIGQDEFQFWAVKRAFTRIEFRLDPCVAGRREEGFFGFVPNLVRSRAGFGTVGEFDLEALKAEVFVDVAQEVDVDGWFLLRSGLRDRRCGRRLG